MVVAGFPGLKPRAIVWPSLRDSGGSPLKKGWKYSRNLRDTTLAFYGSYETNGAYGRAYSAAMWAPFSATDRFIRKTKNTSAKERPAKATKVSK